MQKQQGFTLIELVVVIIILGILAVTAAPKFINLQGDARVSALSGMKAAIQSANTLVYSKAALAGQEKLAKGASPAPAVTLSTGVVAVTQYGYLQGVKLELEKALDITFNLGTSATNPTIATAATGGSDWTIFVSSGVATIWQVGAPATCTLTYKEASSATVLPTYVAISDTTKC
ncbi:prepilin-type N-terminal cleavage/methylation domain-containing protein [Shewanella sp. Arc9-LZ]|jgi:MSHA pilin protein MshA|uniref:prepilin-type N-terminal cleavage/methylation domain-containing protein n=1 Tax=Shewanella sp. Arc9-LZ TaxID=2698686 RepID=UPI00137C2C01|nr:prepilin-type N-terminal cleavage/methylation domain-containing protein [Shewanella sp. Arc9-LZ]QHS15114.1 prepilin-type N-terminal cleavage/methylation domain-containing protein [Shewanella sp. Arc9-LZ]